MNRICAEKDISAIQGERLCFDSPGMMPVILIGTAANEMIDAIWFQTHCVGGGYRSLSMYRHLYGTITMILLSVINRIRAKWQDFAFARLFGQSAFYALPAATLLEHLLLPLLSY